MIQLWYNSEAPGYDRGRVVVAQQGRRRLNMAETAQAALVAQHNSEMDASPWWRLRSCNGSAFETTEAAI